MTDFVMSDVRNDMYVANNYCVTLVSDVLSNNFINFYQKQEE